MIRKIMVEDSENFLAMLTQLDNETKYMMYEPGERLQDVDRIRDNIKSTSNHNDLLLCVTISDEIVGFLSAGRGSFHRNLHSAYIVIGILNKGQSKGLGTSLFEELLVWTSAEKIARLELTVVCDNTKAIALYRNFGFEIEGIKHKSLLVDGNYVDEFYMARTL